MRIASLSPATTEILFGLGIGLGKRHQIVCTDQFSNYPDAAKALPHLRDHVKVDIEELRKFQPEIIFTSTVIQEGLSRQLKMAGLPVIHQDPRTIDQIYEATRQIGMLLGLEQEARAVILKMQQGFNDVKRKAGAMRGRGAPPARLYIEEWHDPPYASGNWVPEVARIAGAEQFPIAAGAVSPIVTLEEVQRWNPDMIVISWCGAGSLASKEVFLKRPGWEALAKNNVRVIDDSLLNRPGPRLVEGAQRLYGWVFEMLH